jgi:hypothetical protein
MRARARSTEHRRSEHLLRIGGRGEGGPQGGGVGVGGDELFGGYATFARDSAHPRRARGLARCRGRFRPRERRSRDFPRTRVGARLDSALAFGGDVFGAYYAERGLFAPDEVRRLLAPEIASAVDACEPRAELRRRIGVEGLAEDEQVSALEIRQYLQVQLLRDADAVEHGPLARVRTPLVDRDLLRAASRVPARRAAAGPAKRHLREAPRPPVPPLLWQRRKQGFTLPFEHWLRSGSLPAKLPDHPILPRTRCARSRAIRPEARALVAPVVPARAARVPGLISGASGPHGIFDTTEPGAPPQGRRRKGRFVVLEEVMVQGRRILIDGTMAKGGAASRIS